MFFVTIKEDIKQFYVYREETMNNDMRPYLLIKRLDYRGESTTFAVPLRSNISNNYLPFKHYFPLPDLDKTRQLHTHGLHYVKMFPIPTQFLNKFNYPDDSYNNLFEYIYSQRNKIIMDAQQYLIDYEKGEHVLYSTPLEEMMEIYNMFRQ